MNHDEDMILGYLRKFPNAFVSAMEICKRAGDRRRFASEPDWAKPILVRMTQQRVLECNITGQYRIKPEEEEEGPKKHGRPYEPRPEPPAAAVGEPKVEVTAKPEIVVPTGEKEKAPTVEVIPHSAAAAANTGEAKKHFPAQVDDNEVKVGDRRPPCAGSYNPDAKKAA